MYARDIIGKFPGELWTVSEGARDEFGLYWKRCGRTAGFNTQEDTINGGGNSGFQAIHLAATFGASRIALLGYDMQRTGGKTHWHGDHKGGLRNGKGFDSWVKQLGPLARDLEKMGVEVVNLTPTTAIRCFKKQTIEEFLCDHT